MLAHLLFLWAAKKVNGGCVFRDFSRTRIILKLNCKNALNYKADEFVKIVLRQSFYHLKDTSIVNDDKNRKDSLRTFVNTRTGKLIIHSIMFSSEYFEECLRYCNNCEVIYMFTTKSVSLFNRWKFKLFCSKLAFFLK